MKRTIIPAMILLAAVSCGHKQPDEPQTSDEDKYTWAAKNAPVEKIDVYVGSTLVETYSFTYDDENFLKEYTLLDKAQNTTLQKYDYSYNGRKAVATSKKATVLDRKTTATLDRKNGTLASSGSWEGADEKLISFNKDGMIQSCEMKKSFSSGKYSSESVYSEIYTVKDGDIVSVTMGASSETTTPTKTGAFASTSLVYEYTYSEDKDLQNFGAYLMISDFPVWVPAELPGNAHLITGMKARRGNVYLPQSFTVEYTFNSDGSIKTATRTDYNGTDAVVSRTYKYSYL